MPSSNTNDIKSKYSKQIDNYKIKIEKYNIKINQLEQNKPVFSFNKIPNKSLKDIGFKSKKIAKSFAWLTNVKSKDFKNAEAYLTALKTKMDNFKKIGLSFDNTILKTIDTSSDKVKQNRLFKIN